MLCSRTIESVFLLQKVFSYNKIYSLTNQYATSQKIFFFFFFLFFSFCQDCKAICDEPEEDFLAFIGDPKFNPKRDADGALYAYMHARIHTYTDVYIHAYVYSICIHSPITRVKETYYKSKRGLLQE